MNIQYRDRQTKAIITEVNNSEKTLYQLYETTLGQYVLKCFLTHTVFSKMYGKLQDLPWSRSKILSFIRHHHIDLAEVELPINQYRSFNQFFTRRLKANARLFVAEQTIFCAPVDGKILVLSNLQEHDSIPVKGITFSVAKLLNDASIATRYVGGTALIFRLAPYDYHRFHFPVRGVADSPQWIPGGYDSVHPIALRHIPDVFCRNQRYYSTISTAEFGQIACVEVGAMTVGSIVQTYQPGSVLKGQEKGYFQYGGSTVVLLLEPDVIVIDNDLLEDSSHHLEVQVRAGTKIGQQS